MPGRLEVPPSVFFSFMPPLLPTGRPWATNFASCRCSQSPVVCSPLCFLQGQAAWPITLHSDMLPHWDITCDIGSGQARAARESTWKIKGGLSNQRHRMFHHRFSWDLRFIMIRKENIKGS
jgi:hypothetical protein